MSSDVLSPTFGARYYPQLGTAVVRDGLTRDSLLDHYNRRSGGKSRPADFPAKAISTRSEVLVPVSLIAPTARTF